MTGMLLHRTPTDSQACAFEQHVLRHPDDHPDDQQFRVNSIDSNGYG